MRILQTLVLRDTYLQSDLELFQTMKAFVVPKTMKAEKKAYLEKWMQMFMDYGISVKMYEKVPPVLSIKLVKRGGEDGFTHYDGLQAYIEANTRVEPLKFDKLDYLFRIYLTLITVILLAKFVHYYVRTIDIVLVHRRLRRLRRRTKRKLASFIRTLCSFFNVRRWFAF